MTDCMGAYDPDRAQPAFVDYPRFPLTAIEAAAQAAADAAFRSLAEPYVRGPRDPRDGDRAFAWRLKGEPGMAAKVLASSERWTVRAWKRGQTIANRLQAPPTIRIPRVVHRGTKPAPWLVQEAAIGIPATTASLSPARALEIVLGVQATRVRAWSHLDEWALDAYRRQIIQPLRELARYGVISDVSAATGRQLAENHLAQAKVARPVLSHNDLALRHIFLGDAVPWVIDWEDAHHDRLLFLDVAHLMLNDGWLDLDWAQELGRLAVSHFEARYNADLRSNLIVTLLERATGNAYDALRRQRRQSVEAVKSLCAVISGELLGPVA
ncbi:MAG: hypothetical protein M3082_20330 [Candidatus Dormibacteraeota bacterium]|nr:hypothetical protein [Candidatus Dormibacteraeota bacterium]